MKLPSRFLQNAGLLSKSRTTSLRTNYMTKGMTARSFKNVEIMQLMLDLCGDIVFINAPT